MNRAKRREAKQRARAQASLEEVKAGMPTMRQDLIEHLYRIQERMWSE